VTLAATTKPVSVPERILPFVRASELAHEQQEQRWLIRDLWASEGVGVIGGSPKCLLCRARHNRHYAASRIMPRGLLRPVVRGVQSLRDAA